MAACPDGKGFNVIFEHFKVKHLPDQRRLECLKKTAEEVVDAYNFSKMNEQIQQIAERLAGLRDALEITPEEMAKVCNLTTEQYLLLESGTVDISVSVLHLSLIHI